MLRGATCWAASSGVGRDLPWLSRLVLDRSSIPAPHPVTCDRAARLWKLQIQKQEVHFGLVWIPEASPVTH